MTLENVKKYLRIDEDHDDDMLQMMMSAAEQYIVDAVGRYDETDYKAQLLYLAIVQDLYEHREFNVEDAKKRSKNYTFASIILQLQCKYAQEGEADGD